tara:strand:+ start:3456 stop:6026 length:2571 start_codon:yes stop_codon:yes gene_type:complete
MAKIEFVVDMDPEVEEEITPGPFGEEGRDRTRPGRFVSELLQDATNVLSPDGAIDRAISHPLESERDKLPRRTFLNFLSLFPELGSAAWNPYDTAGMISGALSGATGISPSDPGNLITGLGGEDYESRVPGLADYKRIASEAEQNRDVEKYEQMKEGAKNTFALERMLERPLDAPLLLSGLLGPGLRRLPMIRESPELMKLVRYMEDPATASVGAGFPRFKELYGERPDFIKPTFQAKRGWNYLKDVNLGKYFNRLYEGINTDGAPKYGFTRIITNPDLRVKDAMVELKGVGKRFLSEASSYFLTSTSAATKETIDLLKRAPGQGKKRWAQTYGYADFDKDFPEGFPQPWEAGYHEARKKIKDSFYIDAANTIDAIQDRIKAFQGHFDRGLAPWRKKIITNEEMSDLKDLVVKNLEDFNLDVGDEFVVISKEATLPGWKGRRAPLAVYPKEVTIQTPTEGRQTLKRPPGERGVTYQTRSGDVQIIWPKDLGKGKTTPILPGKGRKAVARFHKKILDTPPTNIDGLKDFLDQIQGAIDKLTTDTKEISQPRRALSKLRFELREFIEKQYTLLDAEYPHPETGEMWKYRDVTRQYESDKALLADMKANLGLEPKMLNTPGEFRSALRTRVDNNIFRYLDEGEDQAWAMLKRLEQEAGQDFAVRGAAIATMDVTGGGLTGKSHVIQHGNNLVNSVAKVSRNAIGFGMLPATAAYVGVQVAPVMPAVAGAATALLSLIPATLVFSPRYMSKMLLEISDPVQRQNVKIMFDNVREGMKAYARTAATGALKGRPSQWIAQGATIGQVAVRLANAGDWESDEIIRGEQIDTIDSGLKEDWDRAKLQYPSATSQQRGTIFVPEE